jgi:hypothetical protein
VPVVLGHKFSSLFFNGETIEVVGEWELVFKENFLSITYTTKFHHQCTTLNN